MGRCSYQVKSNSPKLGSCPRCRHLRFNEGQQDPTRPSSSGSGHSKAQRDRHGQLVQLFRRRDRTCRPHKPLSPHANSLFCRNRPPHAHRLYQSFEGIRSGERSVFSAPSNYPVRRVIVISDGQANVGPTSPEVLGALATRGSEQGIQVTAVGVGLDYDERTLNALAINSSGRLYHMTESSELAGILDQEMGLIRSTAATDASIEIVPAPGVEILGIEKTRFNRENGSVKVPLGSMFSGQHREMLVRVRVSTPTQGTHPLASVRLHFRDPSDGNIDRVQETVARYQVTKNRDEIAKNENARTKDILTIVEAGKLADAAAVKAEQGDIERAAQELAQAEQKLLAQAAAIKDEAAKKRVVANAANITKARKAADAAVAAPAAAKPAAARAVKLETNQAGMRNAGF
ncbi:MAG: VWA domain-containing protein [Polyangiaceae bacterium]|nr:VWA domain-containing protein [Polyangiaceae bacterium]